MNICSVDPMQITVENKANSCIFLLDGSLWIRLPLPNGNNPRWPPNNILKISYSSKDNASRIKLLFGLQSRSKYETSYYNSVIKISLFCTFHVT